MRYLKPAAAYAGAIIAGLFFSVAVGLIYPFDDDGGQEIGGIAAWILFAGAFSIMSVAMRWGWIAYGMLTFACRMIAEILFWDHMYRGTWEPPHPDIVHRITHAGGAASSEAHVSEIFLELWLVPTAAFIVFALILRAKRAQTSA